MQHYIHSLKITSLNKVIINELYSCFIVCFYLRKTSAKITENFFWLFRKKLEAFLYLLIYCYFYLFIFQLLKSHDGWESIENYLSSFKSWRKAYWISCVWDAKSHEGLNRILYLTLNMLFCWLFWIKKIFNFICTNIFYE